MAVELDRFLHLVLPYATSCPDVTAEQYVLQAAIEFCEAVRPWRYVDTFTTIGTNPEPVAIPAQSEIHQIEEAWFEGRKLDRATYVEGTALAGRGEGAPSVIYQAGPDTVLLSPSGKGPLDISLFLKPSRTADTLPDFFMAQYAQVIADGALSRILMLPEQPFSNPALGTRFAASFEGAKVKNFRVASAGQQRAPRRTHARYF